MRSLTILWLEGDYKVGAARGKHGVYEKLIKRLFDIILSFFGLLLLSPVFVILADSRSSLNRNSFTVHELSDALILSSSSFKAES